MKLSKSNAFTLIELLVVIAIIGILSATIFVAGNSARNQAKDARIKSDIVQIQAKEEILFDNGGYQGTCLGNYTCPTSNVTDTNITNLRTDAWNQSGNVSNNKVEIILDTNPAITPATKYAIWAWSNGNGTRRLDCVDSEGLSSTSNGTGWGVPSAGQCQ